MNKNKIIDNNENYRDSLKDLILNYSASEPNMGKMIYALSFYIVNMDKAYCYNLPFLPHQYDKFTIFLKNAKQKYNLLLKIVNIINESSSIKKHLEINKNDKSNITISINDFWVTNLYSKIDLYDVLSIEGASRKSHADIFTVRYESEETMRIRSKNIMFKNGNIEPNTKVDNSLANNALIKLVEDVLKVEEGTLKGENIDA